MNITSSKEDLLRNINEFQARNETFKFAFRKKNSKLENSLRSAELRTVYRAPVSIKLNAKEDWK